MLAAQKATGSAEMDKRYYDPTRVSQAAEQPVFDESAEGPDAPEDPDDDDPFLRGLKMDARNMPGGRAMLEATGLNGVNLDEIKKVLHNARHFRFHHEKKNFKANFILPFPYPISYLLLLIMSTKIRTKQRAKHIEREANDKLENIERELK